jgi:hypothetical protein
VTPREMISSSTRRDSTRSPRRSRTMHSRARPRSRPCRCRRRSARSLRLALPIRRGFGPQRRLGMDAPDQRRPDETWRAGQPTIADFYQQSIQKRQETWRHQRRRPTPRRRTTSAGARIESGARHRRPSGVRGIDRAPAARRQPGRNLDARGAVIGPIIAGTHQVISSRW